MRADVISKPVKCRGPTIEKSSNRAISDSDQKTTVFVRDTQPFCKARFSFREVVRFVGIGLDQAIAARMT